MTFLLFWAVGILAGTITAAADPGMRSVQSVAANLLYYQLTITVSATGLWCFAGHVFKSEEVSRSIGWAASPFQKELGCAELGIGAAGICCIWFGRDFWLCTILVISPLLIGAAYFHLKEMIGKHNFKAGNAFMIIPDLLIPGSLIICCLLQHRFG